MSAERFYELATRFVGLRMQFLRWTGEQPGDEPIRALLQRTQTARQHRLARKEASAPK